MNASSPEIWSSSVYLELQRKIDLPDLHKRDEKRGESFLRSANKLCSQRRAVTLTIPTYLSPRCNWPSLSPLSVLLHRIKPTRALARFLVRGPTRLIRPEVAEALSPEIIHHGLESGVAKERAKRRERVENKERVDIDI